MARKNVDPETLRRVAEATKKLQEDTPGPVEVEAVAKKAGVDLDTAWSSLLTDAYEEEASDEAPRQQASQAVQIEQQTPVADTEERRIGICLSGGGIRSASFSMGAHQALQADGVGERAAVLTTVSGGGYFGGALEMCRARGVFDVDPEHKPPPLAPGSREELYVRQHSSFLARTTREKFQLVVHLLVGISLNLLILTALLFVLLRPTGWLLSPVIGDEVAALGQDSAASDFGEWWSQRFDSLAALLPVSSWLAVAIPLGVGFLASFGAIGSWITEGPADEPSEASGDRSSQSRIRSFADAMYLFGGIVFGALIVIPFSLWLAFDLFGAIVDVLPFLEPGDDGSSGGSGFIGLFLAGGSLAFITTAVLKQLKALGPTWWARIAAFVVVPLLLLAGVAVILRGGFESSILVDRQAAAIVDTISWGIVLTALATTWVIADPESWSMYPLYRDRLANAFAVERYPVIWESPEALAVRIKSAVADALRGATDVGEGESRRCNEIVTTLDPDATAARVCSLEPDEVAPYLSTRVDGLAEQLLLSDEEISSTRTALAAALEISPDNALKWTVASAIRRKLLRQDPEYVKLTRWDYRDFRAAEPEPAPESPTEDNGDSAEDALHRPRARPGVAVGPPLVSCAAANIRDVQQTVPGLGAASFYLSEDRIGSAHPGIGSLPTSYYRYSLEGSPQRRNITVPAAMAISGAALSPAMGKQSKRWIGSFMALANARLGVWLPNPRWMRKLTEGHENSIAAGNTSVQLRAREGRPLWFERPRISYLMKELLGIHAIDDRFIYITDGGHYDNLGLVEALRRGCHTVFVVDASGEEPGVFTTLGQAMALARSELGVSFNIDLDRMRGQDEEVAENYDEKRLKLPWRRRGTEVRGGVLMQSSHVWGAFNHRPVGEQPGFKGEICYIKTGVTSKTPWQVRAYWEAQPNFPNHSTADQDFSYDEFEAYRALGYWAAETALIDPVTSKGFVGATV